MHCKRRNSLSEYIKRVSQSTEDLFGLDHTSRVVPIVTGVAMNCTGGRDKRRTGKDGGARFGVYWQSLKTLNAVHLANKFT